MAETALTPIEIGLTAAIVAVEDGEPAILVAGDGETGEPRAGLPFGPFDPLAHRTFEIGLRAWVEAQTGLRVGYVEQLYTFGDRGRHAGPGRCRPAHGLGRLSGAHPHAGDAAALEDRRRGLRAVVSLLSVGGLAREAPRDPRRPSSRCSSEWTGTAAWRARPRARLARAAAAVLRRRRLAVGRGEGARPLRDALRGRAWSRKRGATGARPRSRATSCRRSASRCASITAAFWRPRSRGCAPS